MAAKKTVKKTAPKQKVQTSEELGLLLGQQYVTLMTAQQNIVSINKELERRKSEIKEDTNG